MATDIQIESLEDLPPKKTRGPGKWQKKLHELDEGTVFTIEDDIEQSAISKYRSIRIAAKTLGHKTSMRQMGATKIMVKIVSKNTEET